MKKLLSATTKPANGTRRFRLSIFQLVLLTTGIAALLAWALQDRERKLVWLDSTLKYQAPPVPDSYNQNIPKFVTPSGLAIRPGSKILRTNKNLDHGADLFLTAYREGWDSYRYHFYSNFDGNDPYEIQSDLEDADLSSSENVESAAILAYANGYNASMDAINELLLTHAENELRSKLARKKANPLPILLIAIGCLSVFGLSMLLAKNR